MSISSVMSHYPGVPHMQLSRAKKTEDSKTEGVFFARRPHKRIRGAERIRKSRGAAKEYAGGGSKRTTVLADYGTATIFSASHFVCFLIHATSKMKTSTFCPCCVCTTKPVNTFKIKYNSYPCPQLPSVCSEE